MVAATIISSINEFNLLIKMKESSMTIQQYNNIKQNPSFLKTSYQILAIDSCEFDLENSQLPLVIQAIENSSIILTSNSKTAQEIYFALKKISTTHKNLIREPLNLKPVFVIGQKDLESIHQKKTQNLIRLESRADQYN